MIPVDDNVMTDAPTTPEASVRREARSSVHEMTERKPTLAPSSDEADDREEAGYGYGV